MIFRNTALAAASALALAACSGGSDTPAENTAEALENAADQLTPGAAAVLENAADAVREQNVTAPLDAPGSPAQQALEKAATVDNPQGAQPAPPAQGAKPHAKGDPVPPPKVTAEHDAHGNSH
jgi:ABC-type glycerol-3-phosphate transport system substrate-binding protein